MCTLIEFSVSDACVLCRMKQEVIVTEKTGATSTELDVIRVEITLLFLQF